MKHLTTIGSALALFAMMATAAFGHDGVINTGGGMNSFVQFVVYLIIAAVIFGILLFLVNRAPFIPAEAKTIIQYIIYFIAALFIISLLLNLIGKPLW